MPRTAKRVRDEAFDTKSAKRQYSKIVIGSTLKKSCPTQMNKSHEIADCGKRYKKPRATSSRRNEGSKASKSNPNTLPRLSDVLTLKNASKNWNRRKTTQ